MRMFYKLIALICIMCMLCGCSNDTSAATMETNPTIIETESPIETTEVVEITEPVIEEPTESPFKEYEYFSEDVYYDFEYIANGEVIPHVFFQPSTAQDYEKLPLILWLHGSGQKNSDVASMEWSGLSKAMVAWDFMHLEGMNAYILAPHLVQGDFWSPYWCCESAAEDITDLLNYYIENYNIDPNQIAVSGHSLGGQGAVYMPQVLPDTFCAMAPLSIYNPCIELTNTEIPAWCFQGEVAHGEAKISCDYAYDKFAKAYGKENVTSLPVGHGALPMAVFSMDLDGNLRTDLFEWFAEQMAANVQKKTQEQMEIPFEEVVLEE